MFKYDIKAQQNGRHAIYIYGFIGDTWALEASPTALELAKDLEGLGDVDVFINSKGGSVGDAVAMHTSLSRHTGVVRTYADSQVFSAALPVFMAGSERYAPASAMFMIHAPLIAPWEALNSKQAKILADMLDKYVLTLAPTYKKAQGFTDDDIMSMLTDGEDHYINAEEALEKGVITALVDTAEINNRFTEQVAAVATKPEGGLEMPTEDPKPAAPTVDAAAIESEVLARVTARNQALAPVFAMHRGKPGIDELERKVLSDPAITADQAREAILTALGNTAEPLNVVPEQGAVNIEDQVDKRREAMSAALLGRMGAGEQDTQNPYRGYRLSDMARASLEHSGIDVKGQTPEEFANKALSPVLAAQTTSDLPVVLENTMHKLVLTGFNAAPTTWDRICKQGDVTDFRAWKRMVPGLIGNLDDVDEHGNYRDKPLPDAEANSVAATRKGNIISITPEVLVNDDLGYIQNMANDFGGAGARTIDRRFYALLASNPVLADGIALFHASHGNLAGTPGAPSVASIDAGAVAMSIQTAPGDDAELLDIVPAVALSGRALKGTLIEVIGAEYNDDTSKRQNKPNRVRNIVSDIVGTARVTSATAWYLFANPTVNPVFEVVFLNGQRTPRLVQEENFRNSGLSWKVELPFGVGAIDYRGGYLNAGA